MRSVQDREYSDSEDIDRGEKSSLLSKTPSTTPDAEVKVTDSPSLSLSLLSVLTAVCHVSDSHVDLDQRDLVAVCNHLPCS